MFETNHEVNSSKLVPRVSPLKFGRGSGNEVKIPPTKKSFHLKSRTSNDQR